MFWKGKGKNPEGASEQPAKPHTPSVADDKETWVAMAVPVEQVVGFSKLRGALLMPTELAQVRQKISETLKKNGFEIEVGYHEALGILADQLNYATLNREVLSLEYIALWRHVDAIYRKKLQIDVRVECSSSQKEELKKLVQQYIASVTAKRRQREQEELLRLGVPSEIVQEQPMAAESTLKLITWEAEVQARRHEKIPKDEPIPPDILEKYMKMAWGRYNQLHEQRKGKGR